MALHQKQTRRTGCVGPAVVVPLPTALTPEQRQQQAAWRRHARTFTAFLENPSAEREAHAHSTGKRWITTYLGNGEDAQRALRLLDERLFKTRFPPSRRRR